MRLNGKMNKKQPFILLAVAVAGVMSFQNCSKVGVQDLAATNEKIGIDVVHGQPDQPVDNGQGDPAVGMPVVDMPDDGSNMVPDSGSGDPVIDKVPPMPAPAPHCKKMHELGLVILDKNMQTVKCLKDANQKCVVVCHKPAQKEKSARTKLVHSEGALKAHLGHGDTLGACKAITQEDEVCESEEHEHLPPKKYGDNDKGRHYDDKGHSCGKSGSHEHANNPGDDRDDDDEENHDHR